MIYSIYQRENPNSTGKRNAQFNQQYSISCPYLSFILCKRLLPTRIVKERSYSFLFELLFFIFLIVFCSNIICLQVISSNHKDNMSRVALILIPILIGVLSWQLANMEVEGISNLTQDPPQTVPYVDVNKYLGPWYEQAVIPFYFERNCEKTVATYSLNKDGTIRVDNVCYRNGVKHESVGKAFPDPEDKDHSNAKLKVEFSSTFDIEANYWIVRLDKDYTYSVVSSPTYKYLWILYREPHMPEVLFQAIYQDLQKNGFPVEKLRRTVQ